MPEYKEERKMKHSKFKLFQSVVALLLCLSMFVGTTFAWFTDSVTSSGNIIKSGKLDVEMYWAEGAQDPNAAAWTDASKGAIFDYDQWEPGYAQVRHIKIVNKGNLELKYQMQIMANGAVSELADVIDVYYVDPAQQITQRSGLTAERKLSNLTQALKGMESTAGGQLSAGQEVVVTIGLKMQEEAGNEYQNLAIGSSFSIVLLATQAEAEFDSFGQDYDAGASFDFPDTTFNDAASANVNADGENKVAEDVNLQGAQSSAKVPAGVQLEAGAEKLKLTVNTLKKSDANITLGVNDAVRSLDVHVQGVSRDNDKPMEIVIQAAAGIGINDGNLKLYHVENGVTVEMVRVANDAQFTEHNQFKYDEATGNITLYMATFSEIAMVADTVNEWNGTVATAFAGGEGTAENPYLIANADQFAYFGDQISAKKGSEAHYKLISNLNFGGEAAADKGYVLYPVGYHAKGGDIAAIGLDEAPEAVCEINSEDETPRAPVARTSNNYDTNGIWYTYGGAFAGSFDGAGHTIANIYQNTWIMRGNYDGRYYKEAMGLFGYVYDGTIKNLTVENFQSDGEFTPTGVIAAYAAGDSIFENIAITKCNPRVYNTGNGGIIGIAGSTSKAEDDHIILKNITVDNSNKISALWGSWDVACGGLVGMYRGNVDGSGNPTGDTISFENCHVAAQIDVYNDVCANYQYYAYRYAGMIIGSVRHNTTNADGKTIPNMKGISASNCTVNYGDWNDYYYCEFVKNTIASYTHDYQFSRVDKSEIDFDTDGKITGCKHDHESAGTEIIDGKEVLLEDKTAVYLPFHQLFTGYSWGVSSIGLKEYSGIVTDLGITEGDDNASDVKFTDLGVTEVPNSKAIKASELFGINKNTEIAIKSESFHMGITNLDENGNVIENGNVTAMFVLDEDNWADSTITLTGTGRIAITVQDYYFCTPTTITVTVTDRQEAEKFDKLFTGSFTYRVGNLNDVPINKLFAAKKDADLGEVTVTSSHGTVNLTKGWESGAINLKGCTGLITVTIQDDDPYCIPTVLELEVVDAVNATGATSATTDDVVLLNNCGFSSLTVSGGHTLYGNGFTMTCGSDSAALDTGYAFVNLDSGILDNVQIVMPNFDHAVLYKSNMTSGNRTETTDKTRYYNVKSGVMVSGNSKIQNSRISGARAAVNVTGGEVTIHNSRIELGAVASVLVGASAKLTMRDVTLVQKPTASTYDSSKVLMGFSVLLICDANGDAGKVTLEGKLVQNAWVSKEHKDYVPSSGQSIINEVMKKSDYLHDLNGDGTNESLNLGFAYMPEDVGSPVNAVNITDNRTNKDEVPYAQEAIDTVVVDTYVYSYKNSNGTDSDVKTEGAYAPNAYGDVVKVTYSDTTDGLTSGKSYESGHWVYELNVDLDKVSGYKLDFSKLSMSVNGTAVTDFKVNGGAKPTSPVAVTAGGTTYTLTATVNGKEHTAYYKVIGTETSKESPSLVAANYEAGLCVASSYGGTWHGAAPALQGIQIKYWSVAESQYKTIDLADYTPTAKGKQNGTDKTWTYSPANGDFTLTLTGGQVHSNNQVDAMPVVCDGKLYFVASSSKGLVNSGNGARSIPVTYSFKDNNGGDELTFSHSWSVAENKDAQYKYDDFCNGTLTQLQAGSSGGSCVTPDTLITLASGKQVRVDRLKGDEELLVWNLETGKLDSAPIMFVDSEERATYKVVHLYFSDGTDVKVVYEHGFWDYDLNKYVYLDENAADYIGHSFAQQDGNGLKKVKLTDVVLENWVTTAWSPVTVDHLCYFVNGMLSMPGGVGGLFNIFDVDPNTMSYDMASVQRDMETYGLFTYEELNAIEPLSEDMFDAAGGAYLKVSIGKGNMTLDELTAMISRYSKFFG